MIDHRSDTHILNSCEIKARKYSGLNVNRPAPCFCVVESLFCFICFIFFLSELLLAIFSSASLGIRNSISSYLKRH